MKTKKHLGIIAVATAILTVAWSPDASAQGAKSSSFSLLGDPLPEVPKTTAEKLQDLQHRHENAFSELSAILNGLPANPEMLGTKDLFTQIDDSVREMKNIRVGCTTVMSSLRADAKTISESSSFTDEQKKELVESAEELAKQCAGLSEKLDLAIKRLDEAYTILPRWNKIHKSYRNLQGQAKASEQVKAQVEEYLKSFVPAEKPAETKDAPAET